MRITKISQIVYGPFPSGYNALHFVVLADKVTGQVKTHADSESLCAKRFPIKTVISEMKDKAISNKKYRMPYEILPFLEYFLEAKRTNNFIPIY